MPADEPLSDERYQELLDRIDRLIVAFRESARFDTLTDHQQRDAGFVLENVGEFLAGYEGVPLDEPGRRQLEYVCMRLYPAKVSAEPAHFETVAPVLAAFLRFLEDRGDLSEGDALASHIEALEDDLISAAADPDNWGMAKSLMMGGELDDAITPGALEEGAGELHRLDLPGDENENLESLEGLEDLGPITGPSLPADPIQDIDPPGSHQESPYTPEEREAIVEAFESISADSKEILDEATSALVDPMIASDPSAVFEHTDITPVEMEGVLNEVMETAGIEMDRAYGDTDDPRVLTPNQSYHFFDWYGRLLVYVNNRFDVVSGIETYEEFASVARDRTYPIREYLFSDCDPASVIDDFVAENPADLSAEALSQVEEWKHYETGEFAIVEHRDTDTVFLDPETPRAFAVTGPESSYAEIVPEGRLPTAIDDVVLLPFEDSIVTDPWVVIDPLTLMVWRQMDIDIDATYAEATHRFGVVESLPVGEEPERTDEENLRFYTKNQDNRERYAEEIDRLKDQSDDLARVYHEQLGKANARRLGREFRDMDLEEAYVAIYDGQVVATAPTNDGLQEVLSGIMPDGKADHPYVYHYDP